MPYHSAACYPNSFGSLFENLIFILEDTSMLPGVTEGAWRELVLEERERRRINVKIYVLVRSLPPRPHFEPGKTLNLSL